MYNKKSSIQKFLHFCKEFSVIGVFHFNSLSTQDWKVLKNEIYKIDKYAKLVVIQSQGTKKLLEENLSQQLSLLCGGPTCFLFCSSFSNFQNLMSLLTQKMDRHKSKPVPPLTFVGAKYRDTFITQSHIPTLLKLKADSSNILIMKAPVTKFHSTLFSPILQLFRIFKANNGN
jgi:ribosomal protein L10